jgi:hypothetical protein
LLSQTFDDGGADAAGAALNQCRFADQVGWVSHVDLL